MESCGSGSAEEKVARLEEALWVVQAQGGDMDAFALLMSRLEWPLLYYLRRLVPNPEDALDLHQEVWLDAFRGLKSLQIPEAFRTWVYRIAHRKVARFRRQEFQQEKLAESFVNDPTGNVEVTVEINLDAKSLHEALRLLPPDQRELLVLHYFRSFSTQELAAILECPPGTVKSRLYHARIALRNIIERKSL